jgi:Zn-finger nucleic acid-binding protein
MLRSDGPVGDPVILCPRDRAQMLKVKRGDVVLDECGRCKGLWFDHRELKAVAHDGDLEKRAAHLRRFPVPSPFACPRCGGGCQQSFVGDVEVDTCVSCHGVWLDANELEEAKRQLDADRMARGGGAGFLSFLARL